MTPLPASAMDEIWMRMASRYGHAWVSQYGPLPDGIAAAEWRGTLAGLTPSQIREGFEADAMRGDDWPPSSTKFRSMCFGVPMMASVRAEIDDMIRWSTKGQGSLMSRFARGVWSRLDGYSYRNSGGKVADRMIRDAYQLMREFVLSGGTLPVDPVALVKHEKPKSSPASPEVAKAHLDKIADLLKTEPVTAHSEVE